ncbi:MAG: type IV pilus modification PilV family protein [Actinomycetota bacterium]
MIPRKRRAAREESGFTLIELILAVTIMEIGVVAVIGGLLFSISSANLTKQNLMIQSGLGSLAEQAKAAGYSDCPSPTFYRTILGDNFDLPEGHTVTVSAVWTSNGTQDYDQPATAELATSIDAATNTIAIETPIPAGFAVPPPGYDIVVGTERMTVTGLSVDELTVDRSGGSPNTSHPAGTEAVVCPATSADNRLQLLELKVVGPGSLDKPVQVAKRNPDP